MGGTVNSQYSKLSDEEKKEYCRKTMEYTRKRLAKMTDEEREAHRLRQNNMHREYMKRVRKERPDVYLRWREANMIWQRKHNESMTDEEKAKRREYQREYSREYKRNMSEEQKEKYREHYRKRYHELKEKTGRVPYKYYKYKKNGRFHNKISENPKIDEFMDKIKNNINKEF